MSMLTSQKASRGCFLQFDRAALAFLKYLGN